MLNRKIRRIWTRLRSHILFIPGLIVWLAILAAIAMVELDRVIGHEELRRIPWMFRAGASGARDVLSTIATSVVQLAAITFSVTIVALALRSQQFGPRLLRNFTTDKLNQGVLGVFLGTFAYSLLVLRAVRDLGDEAEIDAEYFVPLLAVTGAILLALLCLALFVVFVDRVVASIQASSIIHQAARETHRAVERLFPDPLGAGPQRDEEDIHVVPMERPVPIPAPRTGYIQTLEMEGLMSTATEAGVVLRMEAPIGGFVVDDTPMLTAAPAERVDDELVSRLQKEFAIARTRSVEDDPEFGVRQIVDVAVKALSPSDNDPTTAGTATEYLGAVLIHFASRDVPSPVRRDEQGAVRVLAKGPTFRSMADLAFSQIREHGEDDVAATLQLIRTLGRVAAAVEDERYRDVLERHARKVSRGADVGIRDPADREAVNQGLRLVMRELGREGVGAPDYLISPHRT
jgi:uncharacterized membrane protein